jgi:hypothetical protein
LTSTRLLLFLIRKNEKNEIDKPSEAKGMFTPRLYRFLGLTAHPGWARLLVDRYRDLVEVPAPTREDRPRFFG